MNGTETHVAFVRRFTYFVVYSMAVCKYKRYLKCYPHVCILYPQPCYTVCGGFFFAQPTTSFACVSSAFLFGAHRELYSHESILPQHVWAQASRLAHIKSFSHLCAHDWIETASQNSCRSISLPLVVIHGSRFAAGFLHQMHGEQKIFYGKYVREILHRCRRMPRNCAWIWSNRQNACENSL